MSETALERDRRLARERMAKRRQDPVLRHKERAASRARYRLAQRYPVEFADLYEQELKRR